MVSTSGMTIIRALFHYDAVSGRTSGSQMRFEDAFNEGCFTFKVTKTVRYRVRKPSQGSKRTVMDACWTSLRFVSTQTPKKNLPDHRVGLFGTYIVSWSGPSLPSYLRITLHTIDDDVEDVPLDTFVLSVVRTSTNIPDSRSCHTPSQRVLWRWAWKFESGASDNQSPAFTLEYWARKYPILGCLSSWAILVRLSARVHQRSLFAEANTSYGKEASNSNLLHISIHSSYIITTITTVSYQSLLSNCHALPDSLSTPASRSFSTTTYFNYFIVETTIRDDLEVFYLPNLQLDHYSRLDGVRYQPLPRQLMRRRERKCLFNHIWEALQQRDNNLSDSKNITPFIDTYILIATRDLKINHKTRGVLKTLLRKASSFRTRSDSSNASKTKKLTRKAVVTNPAR